MKHEVGDLQSPIEKKDIDHLPDIDYKSQRPLMFNGQVIKSHKELKELIKFDTFDEVIHGKIKKIRDREN